MTTTLITDLRDEADLCRNEAADDIAVLLDAAAAEIERLRGAEGARHWSRCLACQLKDAPQNND